MKLISGFVGQVTTQPMSVEAQRAGREGARQMIRHLELGPTFHETSWEEWGWLLLTIFVGLVVGKVMQFLVRGAAGRLRKHRWEVRALFFECLDGPGQLAALTMGLIVGIVPIRNVSSVPVKAAIDGGLRLLAVISIGWYLYNLVDVMSAALTRLTARTESKLDDQVVPLLRKTLRVFLVVLCVLFGAEFVFGANIGAWLAGLGIAGLAVSLAAQDSLKNLFGSITVLLDRPFQVGDRVVIDGHDGPVEEIGFRSTKIRKGGGELVTIPNSKVVDASVVNVGRRPNIPRSVVLQLAGDTPVEKVEEAVGIVRGILAEPEMAAGFDLARTPPRVFFTEFGAYSLNVQVQYWYVPAGDWWGYSDHAQRFNLKVMRALAGAGIEMAYPTQQVILGGGAKRPVGVVIGGNGEGRG